MEGTPSRIRVPLSGSIRTSAVSGTCFTATTNFIGSYFLWASFIMAWAMTLLCIWFVPRKSGLSWRHASFFHRVLLHVAVATQYLNRVVVTFMATSLAKTLAMADSFSNFFAPLSIHPCHGVL